MKLTNDLHVVGGGRFGFGLSGILDCHVYVVNGGSELALIDPGLGLPGDFAFVIDVDALGSEDAEVEPDGGRPGAAIETEGNGPVAQVA